LHSRAVSKRRAHRRSLGERSGHQPEAFELPELIHYASFDGKQIPAFLYMPNSYRRA
jgi:dipeptidyl aminopeptidase/acylaminoacyl peptidase